MQFWCLRMNVYWFTLTWMHAILQTYISAYLWIKTILTIVHKCITNKKNRANIQKSRARERSSLTKFYNTMYFQTFFFCEFIIFLANHDLVSDLFLWHNYSAKKNLEMNLQCTRLTRFYRPYFLITKYNYQSMI